MSESRRYDRFGRYTGKTRYIKDPKPMKGPLPKILGWIFVIFILISVLK
jgi:hypothetical protein